MKKFGRLRVLHAPSDVGGQAWGLSLAERKLGVDSKVVVFVSSKFKFNFDENLDLYKLSRGRKWFKQILFFIKSLIYYDVFHFYFGQTLLPLGVDLPIIKLFRKKIFFTFQGCDIRQSIFKTDSGRVIDHGGICDYCKTHSDLLKKLRLLMFKLFANKSYSLNPDLMFIDKSSKFLPYAQIDLEDWSPTKNKNMGNKLLRVAHAPSDRKIKGTNFVISAVEKLKKEGYSVSLDLIENVPFEKVKKRLSEADVVIDQINVGWYGALAVEGMSLGKPVICYINNEFYKRSGLNSTLPIINADTRSLVSTLKDILDNKENLSKVGYLSRKYVELVHDPNTIAKRLIKDYEAN